MVPTARKEKLGCRASRGILVRKGSVASMGPLTRENQGLKVRPDLQEWLGRWAPGETKVIGVSVAPLVREAIKGNEESLDIPAFRAEWDILD